MEAIPWAAGSAQQMPEYPQFSPQVQQNIRGMQNALNNVKDPRFRQTAQRMQMPMSQQQGQQCPHCEKPIQVVENPWGRLGQKVAGGVDQAMNVMAGIGQMAHSKGTNPLDRR